jgi:hypothetical protein
LIANSAFDQANTVWDSANSNYTFAANTVRLIANSAFDQANLVWDSANSNYTFAANTVRLIANSAYDKANDSTTAAGSAYDKANTVTTYNKYEYDAAADQNTFSLTYTVGYVDVWVNGSKLANTDFTSSDGSDVVLTTSTQANDIVEILAWNTANVNTLNGKLVLNVVEKSSGYGINKDTDYCIICTTQDFTVTLPSAVGITGQEFVIKNLNTVASANLININTTSSQTIDIDDNYIRISPKSSLSFMSDGSNWILI